METYWLESLSGEVKEEINSSDDDEDVIVKGLLVTSL